MPKETIVSTFIVTVRHDKHIKDLVDLVAGRVYSMDGVIDSTASLVASVYEADQKRVQALAQKP